MTHPDKVQGPARRAVDAAVACCTGALAALACTVGPVPARASTYVSEDQVCPVGGEKFAYEALASISRWGALPDGMPIGSGRFPVELPQCPGNGLVMYREFTPAEVKILAAFLAGAEYKALRAAGETPYYLAYRTARTLGDADVSGLLLSATWEAKNAAPADGRWRRYDEEYVALARALPVNATSFASLMPRGRAANALRELGRFDEAEALRADIVVAPDAGGTEPDAKDNREGLQRYLKALAPPIARHDDSRAPIDMAGGEQAIMRCMESELAAKYHQPVPPPLTPFEVSYCARPELTVEIAEQRKHMAD